MADLEALIAQAKRWADDDVCEETSAEARDLAERAHDGDAAAIAELSDAFTGRLVFGTAGLRGKIGPGPRRMNRVVVSQSSAGFAAYLHDRAQHGLCSTPPSVVVGYDGRRLSETFARDAAEVLAGCGIAVTLIPTLGPTPLTAFAVRHLGVSAGVMITASHNPPGDNGFKVYLGDADDGRQIAPPTDAKIAACIDRAAAGPCTELPRSTAFKRADASLADAYVAETAAAIRGDADPAARAPLTVVYTAMHGVGAALSRRVFAAAGLPAVEAVTEQNRPDSTFPTLKFPNPEEPGSLDLAFARARAANADVVIAQDPDADRLALAPRDAASAAGYRRLTGNELGLLLGWRAAERERRRAKAAGTLPRGTLACTLVSSPALRAVAADYGIDYTETLPGFKWVSRVPRLIFGFEEALGYLTDPQVVHDKDGISAAGDALAMVAELQAAGETVWDLLDRASERFGHFASDQIVLRFASRKRADEILASVRHDQPDSLAGVDVTRVTDLLKGGAEVPANILRFDLADGSRVMMRASGTEPKLKVYLDAFSDSGSVAERREATSARLAVLREALDERFEA